VVFAFVEDRWTADWKQCNFCCKNWFCTAEIYKEEKTEVILTYFTCLWILVSLLIV